MYYVIRYALSRLEPNESMEDKRRKTVAESVMKRLDRREADQNQLDPDEFSRRSRKEDLVLNQYEQNIAAEVVAPEDIAVTFDGQKQQCSWMPG